VAFTPRIPRRGRMSEKACRGRQTRSRSAPLPLTTPFGPWAANAAIKVKGFFLVMNHGRLENPSVMSLLEGPTQRKGVWRKVHFRILPGSWRRHGGKPSCASDAYPTGATTPTSISIVIESVMRLKSTAHWESKEGLQISHVSHSRRKSRFWPSHTLRDKPGSFVAPMIGRVHISQGEKKSERP
jgi:hypothetical protein